MVDNRASQIMTKKLITIGILEPLSKAYTVMQDRKIRHLPVINEFGEIIGILSDRDLQRAMTPHEPTTKYNSDQPEINANFQVKDFMNWPVRSINEEVTIDEVARRMLNEKVSALLVYDYQKHCKGIITTDDLLKYLISLLSKDPGRLKLSLGSVFSDYSFSEGNWV